MGRYTGPKHKLSRREGMDIFGNGGESLQRRLDQPPGVHGRDMRRRRRAMPYQQQLREKQKVKRIYGMRERQFRRFYRMAQKSKSDLTGVALLKLLERRLDNVVYRMGWARTRPQARQFVTHGHILVDGRKVNIPSYLVKPGQTVALKEKTLKIPDVKDLIESGTPVPEWLSVDGAQGRVIREPVREEIYPEINEQMIVEFYSR